MPGTITIQGHGFGSSFFTQGSGIQGAGFAGAAGTTCRAARRATWAVLLAQCRSMLQDAPFPPILQEGRGANVPFSD